MYVMTMISRYPRQIVGFDVGSSVKAKTIQRIVDEAPDAQNYYTDGGMVYLDVDFIGRHRRNVRDKSDTHVIESVNADVRHYIAGLRRKSRCFFRKIETLKAVLLLFINAYNKLGDAKRRWRDCHRGCGRDFGFSHIHFV